MTINDLRRLRDAVQAATPSLIWERAPDFYTAPGIRTVDGAYYLERPNDFLLFDVVAQSYRNVGPYVFRRWEEVVGARVAAALEPHVRTPIWTPWPHPRRSSGAAWSRKAL